MKANSTIAFSVFLVVTLFITEVVFAYSRVGGFSGSFQGYDYTQPRQVIHTVEKNESLWQIAKQFDVDFTKLAEVNGLDNPDLIFPGNKLIIKIQVDGSILVSNKGEPVKYATPFNFTPQKAIAHVVLPDKSDVFAPENPVVSYEVTEAILQPLRENLRGPLVFKSFEKFVRWLSGSLGYSSDMTQARGQASFDPPTGQTFLHSGSMSVNGLLQGGEEIAPLLDNFTPHITGTTSPPPKSL